MALVKHNPESKYAIEMEKWEKPYRFQPFPKMLYRAVKHPRTSQYCVGIGDDIKDMDGKTVLISAVGFNQQCQTIVESDREQQSQMEAGWRETPKEALAFAESRERSIGEQTAMRHYDDKRMSDAAKDEAAAVDASTDEHVPVIPEKRRPGRPRVNAAA